MNYRMNVPSLAVIDMPDLSYQPSEFALISACVKPRMLADVKLEQFRNTSFPMLLTESGIVIDVNGQKANAAFPIFVTPFSIVTDVKLKHHPNAVSPMLVTEFGIVIDVNWH